MATTKITDLPSLTTPDANTSNTVFVVVDKSSGTPTTKQVTLGVLDTAIDDIAGGAYDHANGAFDQANTNATTVSNAYAHANGAFDQANTNTTTAANAYAHSNGAFDQANTAQSLANSLNLDTLQVIANVPTTPLGEDGDSANEVALANDYIYIAIADYDGSTNIWTRFAVTDSW